MRAKVFEATYAGHPVRISLREPETRYCFGAFMRPVSGEDYEIRVDDEELARARPEMPPDSKDSEVEYCLLLDKVAGALLRRDCCIFHAAAFLWRGRAWLLSAPSGTGKTTQLLNWQRLHPGEITVISGDMPVLELRDDGSVWVHPSNWNGKENYSNPVSAPLGGLVYLKQGGENRVERPPLRDLITALMYQFTARPETEEQIRAMSRLLEAMVCAAPPLRFVNLGDDASTELLRGTLLQEEGERNGTL